MTRPFPAGSWHLVGDGIVLDACDVQFELIWRAADGDHPIGSVKHHFEPQKSGFDAVKFEGDVKGVAVNPTINQDQLVLRFSLASTTLQTTAYVPNSDGAHANGRIPSLTYPR